MQLPIDTKGMTLLAGRVEPVIDFETKKQRADSNGVPMYAVDVVAFGEDGPQIWPVKIAGEPKGVQIGQEVKVAGLLAVPWSRGERSGVAFRAESVTAARAAQAAA